jgi:hypothetical protein
MSAAAASAAAVASTAASAAAAASAPTDSAAAAAAPAATAAAAADSAAAAATANSAADFAAAPTDSAAAAAAAPANSAADAAYAGTVLMHQSLDHILRCVNQNFCYVPFNMGATLDRAPTEDEQKRLYNIRRLTINVPTPFPAWIADIMPNITTIHVESTHETIPDDLIKLANRLPSLKTLSMHGLSELPDSMASFIGRIEELDVSISSFQVFPDVLRGATNLKFLDISDSQIRIIPKWLPACCPNLRLLELSCNPLDLSTLIVFRDMPQLERLLLAETGLTSDSLETFAGALINLDFLDVSDNNLTADPRRLITHSCRIGDENNPFNRSVAEQDTKRSRQDEQNDA